MFWTRLFGNSRCKSKFQFAIEKLGVDVWRFAIPCYRQYFSNIPLYRHTLISAPSHLIEYTSCNIQCNVLVLFINANLSKYENCPPYKQFLCEIFLGISKISRQYQTKHIEECTRFIHEKIDLIIYNLIRLAFQVLCWVTAKTKVYAQKTWKLPIKVCFSKSYRLS